MNLKQLIEKGISYELQSIKADRELVKDIQLNLNRTGFECGSADGIWGAKTQLALNRFVDSKQLVSPRFTPAIAQALLTSETVVKTRRQINTAGLELIKSFEGLRLTAYKCPAGVPTIGYGTTEGVKMGTSITREKAEELLKRDLEKFERTVERLVEAPLTDNQFSALVSLTYNIGVAALQRSTLLSVLNQKSYRVAADQFLVWNKVDGKVLAGLQRRRAAERDLFLKS
ncbi:MAG: glycoside hydrolase family protein [Oculatellaceae cyanobacterium bins.114]|nr:glycoside hydrolase family protein [Oculatellaceae cyanobacterium bins.114]